MNLVSPKFFENISSIYAAFTVKDCSETFSDSNLYSVSEVLLPHKKVRIHQVHSSEIVTILSDDDISRKSDSAADGIITDLGDVALEISVADCAPVALVDVRERIIALLHAGWRGTKAKIVENGIVEMKKLGAKCENIFAYIGPAIGKNDYEVGEEFLNYFPKSTKVQNGKIFFDLKGEIERRLRSLGIDNIQKCTLSTYSTNWLESFRRDGDNAERILFYLWMK